MKYRKFNKYEKEEVRSQMLEAALHGEGLYLYRNANDATFNLPRPTKSGLKVVGPKAEFQGDNYYMQFVRSGLLRLIKEIQSPEQQRAANEVKVAEEKLILDQPDMITEQGKVEHVVNKTKPVQKLNESDKEKKPDILLNEGPVEGGFVIVGE